MTLSAQAIERININALTAELMARNWSVYLPVYDDGIDMLATRNEGADIMRIQLKSRWTIDRKYSDRMIYIAFREDDVWYLVSHDNAVKMGEQLGYCATKSWGKGHYSIAKMGKPLAALMQGYTFDTQLGHKLSKLP